MTKKIYLDKEEAAKYLKMPLYRLERDYLAGKVTMRTTDRIAFKAEDLDEYVWNTRHFFSLRDGAKYAGVSLGTLRDHQYAQEQGRKRIDGRVLSNTLVFTREQLDTYKTAFQRTQTGRLLPTAALPADEMTPFPDGVAFTTEEAAAYSREHGLGKMTAAALGQHIHTYRNLYAEKVGAIRVIHIDDLNDFIAGQKH